MLRSYSFIFFRNFYGIRVAYKPKLENRRERKEHMELPVKMKGIHFPALLEEKIFLEEEFLVSDRGELFTII